MLHRMLFVLAFWAIMAASHLLIDEESYSPAHHTPLSEEDLGPSAYSKKLNHHPLSTERLLQSDNPFAPTGEIMTGTPGTRPTDQVLTIDLLGQIASQSGLNLRPNQPSPTTASSLFQTSNINSPLAVTINGLSANSSNPVTALGNSSWSQVSVDEYSNDPSWIAANSFLSRLNQSYFSANQVLILAVQNSSLGVSFNVTYRSVRGFVNAIILVNQTYTASLITSTILNNLQTVDVNVTTSLYSVTKSLLQSLFYDFTLAPLTLVNGTEVLFQGFTLYDLRYRSKNGVYSFIVKSQVLSNGSITGTVLACNPITVSVSTQTIPVLASINLLNVDANFRSVNLTINSFVSKTLNFSNARVIYNSVVVWSNRAGTSILYFLNLTVNRPTSSLTYLAGVNYNLTHRHSTLSYWRESNSGIPSLNPNSTGYQQIGYLEVLSNPIFVNVDTSARANYPTVIVGPLVRIQTERVNNETGFKLTYYGVDGQNVQAAYKP